MSSQAPALPVLPTQAIYLSAVVPVFNEVDTLEEIVRRLERISVVRQIIVVDDASDDGTAEVARRLVDTGRVVMCSHKQNQGKGAALRTGLSLVSEDYFVIQDADLEYDPNDFYAMVEIVRETGASAVYGSRFLGAPRTGMLWTHYLGNRLLTAIFDLLYRQALTDMETCYKLFRTHLLRQVGIDNDRFDVDPELTVKIIRAGYKIFEVPVSYSGRPYLAGKKIRPYYAFSAIKTLWHYRQWRPGMSTALPQSV